LLFSILKQNAESLLVYLNMSDLYELLAVYREWVSTNSLNEYGNIVF